MTKGKTKKEETKKAKEKPIWLRLSKEDLETVVLKLAKQGLTSEKIGLVLRDTYGIPTTKIYDKKISEILKEKNMYEDSTLKNLKKRQEKMKKHLEDNKQDKKTQRALIMISAKISKLQKYKKRILKKRENVGANKKVG